MASVVFQVRDRARGNVSTPMVLWAIAMAVVLAWAIVAPALSVTLSGLALTGLFGLYLGWRRRIGAVLIAPVVSWLFAWFPMEIASMIHFGTLKGFFLGLVIITFGWIGIGFFEFACLGIVALLARSLRGDRDDRVVIIEPDHRA
jgi:hypothetical protein